MVEPILLLLQSCPVAPEPTFDLPEIPIGDIFPFSLIVYWWGLIAGMGTGGSAPSIDIGFGTIEVGQGLGQGISLLRTGMGIFMVGGTALWFYRYITGKGSDGK